MVLVNRVNGFWQYKQNTNIGSLDEIRFVQDTEILI